MNDISKNAINSEMNYWKTRFELQKLYCTEEGKKMRTLLVGGDFGDFPRASGYVTKLSENLKFSNFTTYNGGTFEKLRMIFDEIGNYGLVFWFANVSNNEEKLVGQIKAKNPNVILVTSKNNFGDRYSTLEIISRMLKQKANLCLVFTKGDMIEGTVIDPLNNSYAIKETDIKELGKVLTNRASKLLTFTRKGTMKIGEAIEAPNNERFYEIVSGYAETFHNLIHAEDTERFLGNLSFRCENGFPSLRQDDLIYVSRRNVDKRDISYKSMVAVDLRRNDLGKILYYGDNKPSVDTPIQVALYNYYPRIKFMLHSHTYIKGAPITSDKIPCGAMEEFDSIVKMYPNKDYSMIMINLRGHGSIIMASDISYLENINYEARPTLEDMSTYTAKIVKRKHK